MNERREKTMNNKQECKWTEARLRGENPVNVKAENKKGKGKILKESETKAVKWKHKKIKESRS